MTDNEHDADCLSHGGGRHCDCQGLVRPYMKRNPPSGFWPVRTPQEKYGPRGLKQGASPRDDLRESARGRQQTECTCTPYPYGDGPEIDCVVHGADCGCGRKIGLHGPTDPPSEIVTSGDGETHIYWIKGCRDAH